MNELFFHECRAAGLVFKTSNDWFKWLTCIIRDLEGNAGTKNINLLLWAAKKKRADIIHPQIELFGNIDVVDDLGYITNDLVYNEEDNSLMIVTDTFRKVRRNEKD